jgi:uncharacterized coiled-coil protein SlyX
MTDDLEDFPQWRHSIETRLSTLESTAETQKADLETQAELRAAMDEGMSTLGVKFRTQEKLIQAVSVTQSEHTTQLRTINDRLEKVEGKLDLVHVGVEAIQILLKGLNPGDGDPDALPRSGGEAAQLRNGTGRLR